LKWQRKRAGGVFTFSLAHVFLVRAHVFSGSLLLVPVFTSCFYPNSCFGSVLGDAFKLWLLLHTQVLFQAAHFGSEQWVLRKARRVFAVVAQL